MRRRTPRALNWPAGCWPAASAREARVGLLFANGAAWAVTWLALARIGALSVPLSTFAPGAELARMVRQTDIHALVDGRDIRQRAHDEPPRDGLGRTWPRAPPICSSRKHRSCAGSTSKGSRPPQLVARPPVPARGAAGARGRIRGRSRRRPGDHQHLGCDGCAQVRGAHARFAGPSRRASGGAAGADQRGSHLFAHALLLGRRPHHGAARRPRLRGGRRRTRSGSSQARRSN